MVVAQLQKVFSKILTSTTLKEYSLACDYVLRVYRGNLDQQHYSQHEQHTHVAIMVDMSSHMHLWTQVRLARFPVRTRASTTRTVFEQIDPNYSDSHARHIHLPSVSGSGVSRAGSLSSSSSSSPSLESEALPRGVSLRNWVTNVQKLLVWCLQYKWKKREREREESGGEGVTVSQSISYTSFCVETISSATCCPVFACILGRKRTLHTWVWV